MTVAGLIEKLQFLPPRARVVISNRSDWCDADWVEVIELVDRQGYLSTPYNKLDKIKTESCVALW